MLEFLPKLMSEDTSQTPDENGALDLSGLNFGPAWARDPSESKSLKKFKDRGSRGDQHGGGGRGESRRGGRHDQARGGGGRGSGGGRGGRGGGRRDDQQRRPQRQETPPPAGVNMRIMPAEESLDLLAKRVVDSGQTFSVFDLAKVLLQSRDRFRVTFDSSEKEFYRCREDQSVWVTRDEALRHIWRADWLGKYYEEVKVEGEAPKGNFSAVARCGISNELLGPPNYHGYQEKLNALHRERFSNMSLDAYKAKVRTEHGEEVVEAWLESMKTVSKWKLSEPPSEELTEKELKKEVIAEGTSEEGAEAAISEQSEQPAEACLATDDELTGPDGGESVSEAEGEPASSVQSNEQSGSDDEKPSEEVAAEGQDTAVEGELFDDARAVERHFAEHYFERAFEVTKRAWVMGDIRGNLLSPGLLTLLKNGVAEEKRYPSNLMPLVCRQLSGRHVAVFKWNKKLKVGPSRPHAVPADTQLAERPQVMMDELTKTSGITLKEFWEKVMPANVTDEQRHDWLQDFQWLLGQGHLILLSDTSVHLAKSNGPASAPKKVEKNGPSPKPSDPSAHPEAGKGESQSPPPERGDEQEKPVTGSGETPLAP